MRTFIRIIIHTCFVGITCASFAQTYRLKSSARNDYASDGTILYIPCASGDNYVDISASYTLGTIYRPMTIRAQDVTSLPSGYTVENISSDFSYLRVRFNTAHDGTLAFLAADATNASIYHNYSFPLKSSPDVSYWSMPVLGNNQSGTGTVQIRDQPGSSSFAQIYTPIYNYTSANWTTNYGLRVNGGFNYTTGNTGQYSDAPLSTQGSGGTVQITATSACGTNYPLILFTGTPWITQLYFNGTPSGSSITTSNYSGDCSLSASSATNATWTKVGGTGTYSVNTSNPFICTVVPNNYIRMSVQVSNSLGSGESTIFMVTKSSYRGYSLPYPNPSNDQITVNFEDGEYTSYMLSELALYDKDGQIVRKFDVEEAKAKEYFQSSKSVTFNVKNLKKGTYYLHIKMGKDLETQQIIVS